MTRVLLVSVTAPPVAALESALPALQAAGAKVDVIAARDASAVFRRLGVARCHRMILRRVPDGRPVSGLTPRRVFLGIRWRLLTVLQARSGHEVRTWRLFRQDRAAQEMACEADIVVALDRLAVYTAWRIRRRTGARGFHGISAAVDHVTEGTEGSGMSDPTAPVTVLMMVDNIIEGDGRVQKAAGSMADAGYAVTLLGKAPGRADSWQLGAATVQRVPVPFTREKAQRARLMRYRGAARRLSALVPRRRSGPVGGSAPAGPARPSGPQPATRLADDTALDGLRARFWKRVLGNRCWRLLEPRLLDYDTAYWRVVRELQPQILHAHDYRMLGVAVRSARRLRATGHDVRVVFDSHEFLPGVGGPTLRWRIAYEAYEAAHIHAADAIVAVSPEMAQRIQQHHHLPVTPSVVMNAPPAAGSAAGSGDLRAAIGLAADVPLLVYIGVSAAKRGLDPTVEALAELPGVHLALVTRRNDYVDQLEKTASRLGVADRLHVLGYVPVEDVVPFVSTASAGVQSMVHVENYDVTIATKYFDYARARLPIIQSDVRAMAAMTRSIGNGEVFVAQNKDSFVAAARAVLADLPRYRAAYDRPGLLDDWTWERQAEVLAEVYARVLATPPGTPVPPVPTIGR